jgi:hypothetical protein
MKADVKKKEKLMSMVMSPLKLNFSMTRPLCNMQLGLPCQLANVEFRVVAEHISTRDLVQEYLSNRTYPTSSGWGMPKRKEVGKKHKLVRLPYRFKFEKQFKKPCKEWLDMIETMWNEILGNYTKKEDQLMAAAFGTRPKRRSNRVMDALNFEYPDYEKLGKGGEGVKRKRVVSILNRQAARLIKEDDFFLKKAKTATEPKATLSKKQRLDITSSVEPNMGETDEAPSTPFAAEVAKILKVMTDSLPIKLLSPLGPELTKFLQKKEQPSATKEKAEGQKEWRIVNVMQAIERTSPLASVAKIVTAASAEAKVVAEAAKLATTISDMVAEDIVVAAEESMAAVPDKGKKVVDTSSREKDFDLRHLCG